MTVPAAVIADGMCESFSLQIPVLLPYKALIASKYFCLFSDDYNCPSEAAPSVGRPNICLSSAASPIREARPPALLLPLAYQIILSLSFSLWSFPLCSLGMAQLQAQVFPAVLNAAAGR